MFVRPKMLELSKCLAQVPLMSERSAAWLMQGMNEGTSLAPVHDLVTALCVRAARDAPAFSLLDAVIALESVARLYSTSRTSACGPQWQSLLWQVRAPVLVTCWPVF